MKVLIALGAWLAITNAGLLSHNNKGYNAQQNLQVEVGYDLFQANFAKSANVAPTRTVSKIPNTYLAAEPFMRLESFSAPQSKNNRYYLPAPHSAPAPYQLPYLETAPPVQVENAHFTPVASLKFERPESTAAPISIFHLAPTIERFRATVDANSALDKSQLENANIQAAQLARRAPPIKSAGISNMARKQAQTFEKPRTDLPAPPVSADFYLPTKNLVNNLPAPVMSNYQNAPAPTSLAPIKHHDEHVPTFLGGEFYLPAQSMVLNAPPQSKYQNVPPKSEKLYSASIQTHQAPAPTRSVLTNYSAQGQNKAVEKIQFSSVSSASAPSLHAPVSNLEEHYQAPAPTVSASRNYLSPIENSAVERVQSESALSSPELPIPTPSAPIAPMTSAELPTPAPTKPASSAPADKTYLPAKTNSQSAPTPVETETPTHVSTVNQERWSAPTRRRLRPLTATASSVQDSHVTPASTRKAHRSRIVVVKKNKLEKLHSTPAPNVDQTNAPSASIRDHSYVPPNYPRKRPAINRGSQKFHSTENYYIPPAPIKPTKQFQTPIAPVPTQVYQKSKITYESTANVKETYTKPVENSYIPPAPPVDNSYIEPVPIVRDSYLPPAPVAGNSYKLSAPTNLNLKNQNSPATTQSTYHSYPAPTTTLEKSSTQSKVLLNSYLEPITKIEEKYFEAAPTTLENMSTYSPLQESYLKFSKLTPNEINSGFSSFMLNKNEARDSDKDEAINRDDIQATNSGKSEATNSETIETTNDDAIVTLNSDKIQDVTFVKVKTTNSKENEAIVVSEKLQDNIGVEGYQFRYELSDGQQKEESGKLINVGTENQSIVVQGSYSWVDPATNRKYVVNYVADENGFHANGEHIPKV